MLVSSQETPTRKNPRQLASPEVQRIALRTAFVARFIVLREGRRSRAHRAIELLNWSAEATAEDLAEMFRKEFQANGDKMNPVERDLKRALGHAQRSIDYFIGQYIERATLSFQDALTDYKRSNELLFGEEGEGAPRTGGWRIPGSN